MNRKILATAVLFLSSLWLAVLVRAENPEHLKHSRETRQCLECDLKGVHSQQGNDGVRFRPIVFNAPKIRASHPGGGGWRERTCLSHSQASQVKALLPKTDIGLTVTGFPKFFVYLSNIPASKAEFVLTDAANEDNVVYETSFSLPGQSGIVSFSVPEGTNSAELVVGKTYRWFFSIVCDPNDRSADIIIWGHIQRVELKSTLANQLKTAPAEDYPSFYAASGIWFETLATLTELRHAHPHDSELEAAWQNLLKSVVGLDVNAGEPVFPLKQIEKDR